MKTFGHIGGRRIGGNKNRRRTQSRQNDPKSPRFARSQKKRTARVANTNFRREGKKQEKLGQNRHVTHTTDPRRGKNKPEIIHKREKVWLGGTTGREFESVCDRIFRRCGFKTKPHKGHGADGGIDLLIWNNSGTKIVVECKHHAKPIGRPTVQKLHSAFTTEKGATGAVLVSTGSFTSNAINYPLTFLAMDPLNSLNHMQRNTIALVNIAGLRSLANITGMTLYDGLQPDAKDTPLAPVRSLFAALKSYPDDAVNLLQCSPYSIQIATYWRVDVQINQKFTSRAKRIIYPMKKNETYFFDSRGELKGKLKHIKDLLLCAPSLITQPKKEKLTKLIKKGGNAIPKNVDDFAAAKPKIISTIKKDNTEKVSYKGENGKPYTMICIPDEKHMRITPKPIGIKSTKIEIKILRKTHPWTSPWWDRKIKCTICGEPQKLLNKLLICNNCGAIAHERGCGGYCEKCKKTLCHACAILQNNLLSHKTYCPTCFESVTKAPCLL